MGDKMSHRQYLDFSDMGFYLVKDGEVNQAAWAERKEAQLKLCRIVIAPGIEIYLNEYDTGMSFRGSFRGGHYHQIAYCHDGMYESHISKHRVIKIAPQEMLVFSDIMSSMNAVLPMGFYKGFNIMFFPEQYTEETRALFDCFSIDIEHIMEQLLEDKLFCRFTCNAHMTKIFEEIYTFLQRDEQLHIKLNLIHLLVEIEHFDGVVGKQYRYFDKKNERLAGEVKTYLENNVEAHITMPEIAENFHVSESSIKRNFKLFYGYSPVEYLRRYRMKRAAELLKATSDSVAGIGGKVGYENPSKFAAVFADVYGMTPREFRNSK